jgi:GNAT superfamily N-acetyltransferase
MRHLEELAANAWPGLHTALVEGWVVRFADGYSRRANSVLPLRDGSSSLDVRIARCEELFRREGLAPTFKLFPEAEPQGLEPELERRGYERQACTSVMVLEDLRRPHPISPLNFSVQTAERLSDPWFELYAKDHATPGRNVETARTIMEHIIPETRYVLLEGEDGPAACALAVIEDRWAGIFDVVVRKDLRGKGLGRYLMERTLLEAEAAGAERSYLQVMDENHPAVSLYRSMGYRVAYPYWYRVKGAQL